MDRPTFQSSLAVGWGALRNWKQGDLGAGFKPFLLTDSSHDKGGHIERSVATETPRVNGVSKLVGNADAFGIAGDGWHSINEHRCGNSRTAFRHSTSLSGAAPLRSASNPQHGICAVVRKAKHLFTGKFTALKLSQAVA